MKNNLNDEVHNGTPNILIPSNGVLNLDGVSKLGSNPKGDYVTFLRLNKMTYHTKFNLKMLICKHKIKGGK
jgi:hypothetical protein